MNAVTIIPHTTEQAWLEARKQDVTSTESAALFGMSPYMTLFDLWHRKRSGVVPEFKTNERMKWGNRLEAAIAHGIAEENGWEISPMKDYMRDPDLRLGSSFDFVITSFGLPVHLEIKNVDYLAFRDGWIEHDDGSVEAPEHIEMQVQHQMAVSGFKRSFIGAFVGGNRYALIERERDEAVIAAIRAKVGEFWLSVDAGEEPSPVMPGDAETVIRLNQYAQPGKLIDATGDTNISALVLEYKRLGALEATAKEDKEVVKADLLKAIGDAEKVLLKGWTISAGLQAETPETIITAEMIGKTYGGRKGFRNLRINARK
ncbi:COG5377 Phage-related protein, predicted endonuclease [uncultured Caudovirales phage]|uniref:COG5377 Phage-related protein, predicted endonuclease n=1 Tax=uncultured Caudovirales phage TaxID=2100421 RepID=A0A6J5S3F6_9CAUD|nr:COG5377 Phage-related protein, predicted endonuclease [uncultured Caudovirales phage]